MRVTKEHIKKVIKKGNWIIRADTDGVAYEGFKWNAIGEWTEAPDWDPTPECGRGLHGQDSKHGGFITSRTRLVFCETYGRHVDLSDKVKVRRARILMVGLPAGLVMEGSLSLSGCTLPKGLRLPDNIGGSLDLRGCTLPKGLKMPDSIGEDLDLDGCTLPKGLKMPDSIGGDLDLCGCTLPEGLRLPDSIGGFLCLSGCTLPKGLRIPKNVKRIIR